MCVPRAVLRTCVVVALIALAVACFKKTSRAPHPLEGTSWQLVKFTGGDEKVLRPDDPAEYTVAFRAGGELTARIDCNRGQGTWKSPGPSALELGPLALTRSICPPGSLHDRIVKDWGYVRSFVLKDGHLFLSLMADAGIYELEPAPPARPVPSTSTLRGTVTYRERIALPPEAVVEVALEDASKADAPAEVIARTRVEKPGQPPVPFRIDYDPARIEARHRYVLRARITVGDTLWFSTEEPHPVLTGGGESEPVLVVRRAGVAGTPAPGVGPAPAGDAPLEGTRWTLTALGEAAVNAPSPQREAYLVFDPKNRRVSGSGGCNRLSGSYTRRAERLEFTQMAGTMMACTDGMETEAAFVGALERTTAWKIRGRRLTLLDASGKALATLDAQPER